MTSLTHNLSLSQAQSKLLLDYGIDVSNSDTAIYIIEGKSVHISLNGIDAYLAGQYIIFFAGTAKQQLALCKQVCKSTQEPMLKLHHAPTGMTAYATPLEQYQTEKNIVSVEINNDTDVNLAYNLP